VKLILLEDDPLIAVCTEDALAEAGYEVFASNAGEEAFELLEAHPDVAVMMIDIRLVGGLDGWVVAQEVRASHPDMAIVYTTTVRGLAFAENGVDRSVLLQKPYTLEKAVGAAREAVSKVTA
jgi:DNA-binding NtrC family response regulator